MNENQNEGNFNNENKEWYIGYVNFQFNARSKGLENSDPKK